MARKIYRLVAELLVIEYRRFANGLMTAMEELASRIDARLTAMR